MSSDTLLACSNLELIACAHIPACTVLPHCYAPPFCNLLPEKRGGGGVTTRTCTFASQLTPHPPMNSRTEIIEALLCGRRRELLRSTCRGSTEGWKSCWPRTCCHFMRNIAGSLAARLLPPAARLHGRMTCRIIGLRKPSKMSEKGRDQFSNYSVHA